MILPAPYRALLSRRFAVVTSLALALTACTEPTPVAPSRPGMHPSAASAEITPGSTVVLTNGAGPCFNSPPTDCYVIRSDATQIWFSRRGYVVFDYVDGTSQVFYPFENTFVTTAPGLHRWTGTFSGTDRNGLPFTAEVVEFLSSRYPQLGGGRGGVRYVITGGSITLRY
jgi:hypothetical protein